MPFCHPTLRRASLRVYFRQSPWSGWCGHGRVSRLYPSPWDEWNKHDWISLHYCAWPVRNDQLIREGPFLLCTDWPNMPSRGGESCEMSSSVSRQGKPRVMIFQVQCKTALDECISRWYDSTLYTIKQYNMDFLSSDCLLEYNYPGQLYCAKGNKLKGWCLYLGKSVFRAFWGQFPR